MKPTANLSLFWPELPYLERFDAAANAGFAAVEVLFPYEFAASETRRACLRNGLDLILINAPPPNYTGGERGFAAMPDQVARFRTDMVRVFRYAEVLGPKFVHVMAGETSCAKAKETFIENLSWAASIAPKGLKLTIEPLSPTSMPGYFLNDYALADEVLQAVNLPNVGLQFDSFHAQMIHGDAVSVFEKYRDRIVHVQIGDSPDRGAPGTGEVQFDRLFALMRATDYDGWISGEYHPGDATEETLDWINLL